MNNETASSVEAALKEASIGDHQQRQDEEAKGNEASRPRQATNAAGSGEADHDSGVDENTQNTSPKKHTTPQTPTSAPSGARSSARKYSSPYGQQSTSRSRSARPSESARTATRSQSVPKPFSAYGSQNGSGNAQKKVPMNKVKVGLSPSPNLSVAKSKVGSLNNATYKPGGGQVKIESRKLEWNASPKTETKNEKYTPKGGDKKIENKKLVWNAESKVGSLQNANHKPAGGGEKKIESKKLTWKAESKVGSKDFITHKPGGGQVKITSQKVEVQAKSKVGSLDNVKHKAGGGDKKVFNDVEYLRQRSASGPSSKNSSRRQSATHLNTSDTQSLENKNPTRKTPDLNSYSMQMKRKMSPMSSGF